MFELFQNYPNPFNPTTSLQYKLASTSKIRLTIHNVLGQLIAVLVNSEQAAGLHNVTWNASTSSGIYYYRLEATNGTERFVQMKKMLLLK